MFINYLGIVSFIENESKFKSFIVIRLLVLIFIFGRYRVIDFIFLNFVNVGVINVGIFVLIKFCFLIDYVGIGKFWDLNCKVDGFYIFNYFYELFFISDIKFLKSNMEFLFCSRKEMIIFILFYMICNIDFEDVVKFYEESGVDVIVVYKKIVNENDFFFEFFILMID